MAKIISVEEAIAMIPDGATIMFGGFLGCGSAHHIIDALSKSGKKDFTIIGNDCGMAITKPFEKSALSRILELVQNASERKAPPLYILRMWI